MTYLELENKIRSYKRYDEDLVLSIVEIIKKNFENKSCLLRLRINGIDVFKLDKYTKEQLENTLPHWNCEWLEIKIEI